MRKTSNIKMVNLLLSAENEASITLQDIGFQPDGVIVKYIETTYENSGGGGGGTVGNHVELLKIWCNIFNKQFACIGIAEGQTNINRIELDYTILNPLPPTLDISVYDFNNDLFSTADTVYLGILFQFYKYI